ncbi:CHC2 zinc finger domain-containing protein [Shewanella colwelliana]|uniref:CHC2 zinc finger domain-containing protein n=1 Tax=Shewanella colwelliana TaxID=23 RepID=UPI0022AF706A|nr:CHC2 zinc finger domain-containing protein [Shewanella colwelliana]MCZ4337706.1 CHC2 zinc finger domain-containing protein [Shewanella colwelliana]
MISKQFIQRITQDVSIVNMVEKYVPLKKAGKEFIGCCPFHEEKTPSFSVNDQKGICKCFGCGEGGNIIDFVMKYHSFSFVEAVELIAEENGMTIEYDKRQTPAKNQDKNKQNSLLLEYLNKIYNGARSKSYELDRLAANGVSKEFAETHQIGYPFFSQHVAKVLSDFPLMSSASKTLGIPNGQLPSDAMNSGLSFPLYDHTNKLQGLYIHSSEPKILGSSVTNFANLLYSTDKIDQNSQQVIVTTDPMQVSKLSSAGLKGVMCVASTERLFSLKACNFLSNLRMRSAPLLVIENNMDNIGKFKNDVLGMIGNLNKMPNFKVLLLPKQTDLASIYQKSGDAIFSRIIAKGVPWDHLFAKLIADEVLQHDKTEHLPIVQDLTSTMFNRSPQDFYSCFLISCINDKLAQHLSLEPEQSWQKVVETIAANEKMNEQSHQRKVFDDLIGEIGIKVKGIELEALNRLAALVSLHSTKIAESSHYQNLLTEIVNCLDDGETSTVLSKLVRAGEEVGYLSSSLLKAELSPSERQTVNQKIIDLHEAGLIDNPDEIEVTIVRLHNKLIPTTDKQHEKSFGMQMGI